MKKAIVLLATVVLCAGVSMAQQTTVKKQTVQKIEKIAPPEMVTSAFAQKFIDAVPLWSKTANGNFIAETEQNGTKLFAEFNAEGKWLSTQTIIAAEQLSEAAQTKLKEQYAEMQVAEVKKIEREGISAFYKVKLVKDKESKIAYINDAGFLSS